MKALLKHSLAFSFAAKQLFSNFIFSIYVCIEIYQPTLICFGFHKMAELVVDFLISHFYYSNAILFSSVNRKYSYSQGMENINHGQLIISGNLLIISWGIELLTNSDQSNFIPTHSITSAKCTLNYPWVGFVSIVICEIVPSSYA